ncbi:ATP-binding protein [Lactobacillus sp. PV037]|uniref:ATP-binding protein n=1 Tax=Lactobacillus sp. PV037 TaxID=2594496 RepID=UPI002240499E|nr:ATP-binding protein [Lactobacillus sp. PV037]
MLESWPFFATQQLNIVKVSRTLEKKNSSWLIIQDEVKHIYPIGIGFKACQAGKSMLFKNTSILSTELTEAKNKYQLAKLEKKIQKVDLLILDEMGYVSFESYQLELLLKIIADRSERGSTIVTTNLPFLD